MAAEWYVEGCRLARHRFGWLAGKDPAAFAKATTSKLSADYHDALQFTGLAIEPADAMLFSYAAALGALLTALALDVVIFAAAGFAAAPITLALMLALTLGLPFGVLHVVSEYPKTHAAYMKIHSLGDVPEVLSYVVMYMKLAPIPEAAVRFAATHSHTALARDLLKLLWDVQIRVHHGIDDALAAYADRWGRWSDHFKRALYLVRSATSEPDAVQRTASLDRALDVVLDGTRYLMTDFANRLRQPTLIIYSIGVMIPLTLVAMLPAAGLVGAKVGMAEIAVLYVVLLPLATFLYARRILLGRPATFNPPAIPADHPAVRGLRPEKVLRSASLAGLLVALPGAAYLADRGLVLPLSDALETVGLHPTIFIVWGIAVAVTWYALGTYTVYKKARDDIRAMEQEFADGLYVLGKRLQEGKSPEEAFAHAAATMKGARIAEVFRATSYNLLALHTNLLDALFHAEYGSLRHVHSDRIRATMRLIAEGVQKSPVAVGASILKFADHLKQLEDVERRIRDGLDPITSALRGTATLFAPMIAGVTLGITGIIAGVVAQLSRAQDPAALVDVADAGFTPPSFAAGNVDPALFLLVVGIYMVQVLALLTRFANGIDEGDDRAAYMYGIGTTLPVAVTVFTFATMATGLLFGGLGPGG